MRAVRYVNGLNSVCVDAPDVVVSHLRAFFGEPYTSVQSADWEIRCRVGETPLNAGRFVRSVIGEYGEAWVASANGEQLLSLRSGVELSVDRVRRRISVHGCTAAAAFVETYRCVRQVMVRSLLARGARILHASATVGVDGVTLYVGKKGAGKTTSMLHNIVANDEHFVGNDRVLVWKRNGGLFVYGWPATAFVGLGSLRSVIDLADLQDVHRRVGGTAHLLMDHRTLDRSLVQRLRLLPDNLIAGHKIYLLPSELAVLVGSTVRPGGKLRRIVLPRFAPDEEPVQVRASLTDLRSTLAQETIDVPPELPDLLELDRLEETGAEMLAIDELLSVDALAVSGSNLALNNVSWKVGGARA